MLASQEVLDALRSIGLNLYERKIYVALLAKGIATAGEVSEIAKVPRSRSYDILESLADKGFVVAQPSKPIKYVALAPKDAMDRAKDNMHRRHGEMVDRMDRIKKSSIVQELEKVYKEGFSMVQPFEIAGTLKGNYSINQQLKSLFKKAKRHISIITTEDGLVDLHSKHFKALKRMSKSGVKLKIMIPNVDSKPADAFSGIADVKKIDKPLGRVFIVDDESFMLALTDDKTVHNTQDVAFWAGSDHVAGSVLKPFFDFAWSK